MEVPGAGFCALIETASSDNGDNGCDVIRQRAPPTVLTRYTRWLGRTKSVVMDPGVSIALQSRFETRRRNYAGSVKWQIIIVDDRVLIDRNSWLIVVVSVNYCWSLVIDGDADATRRLANASNIAVEVAQEIIKQVITTRLHSAACLIWNGILCFHFSVYSVKFS